MQITCSVQRPAFLNNRRRAIEKARIQKLKMWHEDVKKIARSELDFITSIFNDKNVEDRDWLRDDEEDDEPKGSGEMVKKDS